MSKRKTISLQNIVKGLKDKSIKILENGHLTNSLVDKLERDLEHNKKMIKEYENKIKKNVAEKDGVTHKGMISLYKNKMQIQIGHYIGPEHYCFNCDSHMYVIPVDEKTIAYVDSRDYWKICEKSGNKYDHQFQKKDVKKCSAAHLTKAKVLVSEIDVPTGTLVFDNYFEKEELYELPKDEKYSSPGINSLLGRNRLMQHLATKNVGYGQMGNMSINVFLKDDGTEIIIGDDYGYDKVKDKEYTIKHKGYKNLGRISLSVWRWMCADKKILDAHKEKIKKEDTIVAKVKPGKWVIEHYFDFCKRGDVIYSRLKLKK